MDIGQIMQLIVGSSPVALLIVSSLGTLVVVGQAVVILTPTKADDAAWEKIKAIPVLGAALSALANFGVIQKK